MKKNHCHWGYCDASEDDPCFCECHRRGEKGCNGEELKEK